MLSLSNPDSPVPKRNEHRKTFRIKLLMSWKNQNRHSLKALFFTLNGFLEKWEMGPESPLIFCSKKGTNPVSSFAAEES